MPRGRHSQTDAVHEAKGNPGKRRRKVTSAINDGVGQVGAAPKELSTQARRIWEKIVPDLQALRFIRDTDHFAFARYCQYVAEWWEASQDVKKNGAHYVTESEHVTIRRLSPAFQVRERLEKHLVALEDRFGLNPVYRQQILQRMAGMTPPPPPGGLFQSPETPHVDDPSSEPTGSPIGLLHNATNVIN